MKLHSPNFTDENHPTPETIAAAIRSLDHQDNNPYFILSKADGQFMQTIKKSPRRFIVEYREGPEGPQWSAGRVEAQAVEQAFVAYLRGDERYKTILAWHDVSKRIDELSEEKRVAAAWHIHVLAHGIITLNRGTAALLQESELLDWMSTGQRKRLQVLTNALECGASELCQLVNRVARGDQPSVKRRDKTSNKTRGH